MKKPKTEEFGWANSCQYGRRPFVQYKVLKLAFIGKLAALCHHIDYYRLSRFLTYLWGWQYA